jgi:nucleoside phosphorylase
MFSPRFEAFSEAGRQLAGDLAERVAGALRGFPCGARLDPLRLAHLVGATDEEDVDLVHDLVDIAQRAEVRVLQDASQIRCPHCDAMEDRRILLARQQRDGMSSCTTCEEAIEDMAGLPVVQRFELTNEAQAEADAFRAARSAKPEQTVVILCALIDELSAVKDQMEVHSPVAQDDTTSNEIYLVSTFEAERVRWRVRAAFVDQTNSAAAAAMATAALSWSPQVALFIGVAGGFPGDVDLGDVVASTIVHEYEIGKDTEAGYEERALQHVAAFDLKQRAGHVVLNDDWRKRIVDREAAPTNQRIPRAYLEPIAAGGKVVSSAASKTFELIRSAAPRAVAVEMEGAGFLAAVGRFSEIDGIVIRGISDMLDGKKQSDRDGWQRQATANAAAFAFELLDSLAPR